MSSSIIQDRMPAGLAAFLGAVAAPERGSVFDPFCAGGVLPAAMNALRDRALTFVGRNWILEDYEEDPGTFDCVATSFPFLSPGAAGREEGYLLRAMDCLKQGGSCACVVSCGFLGRDSRDARLARKRLMEEMDLQMLLLLPEDTFPGARVYSAVLLFRHSLPERETVPVVDLRDGTLTRDTLHQVRAALDSGRWDGLRALRLPREDVAAPGYILTPDRYDLQPEDSRRGTAAPFDATSYALGELDRVFRQCFPDAAVRSADVPSPYPRRRGGDLFRLRTGQQLPELGHDCCGPYPLYQGSGICGYTDLCNTGEKLPVYVINRVGDYCGRVYLSEKPCFVQQNSMSLTCKGDDFDPVFLFFLLRSAELNQWKIRSTKPYIRQEAVRDTWFIVPPLEVQRTFSRRVEDRFRQILDIWEEQSYVMRQEALF